MSTPFNILTIENFGPIKKAQIEVKDMLVFIGPQGSGKSTLAKLITILDDTNFKQNYKATLADELKKYNIGSFLKENTLIKFSTATFKYSYENSIEQKIDLYNILQNNSFFEKLKKEEKENLFLSILGAMILGIFLDDKKDILFRELQKNKNYGLNDNLESLFDEHQDSLSVPKSLLKLYGKSADKIEDIIELLDLVQQIFLLIKPLDSLYIPAERTFLQILLTNLAGLVNNDILIPKNILTATQQLEKAFKNIKTLNLNVVGNYI